MSTYEQNLKNLKKKKEIKTTKVFNLDTKEILEVKNENIFPLLQFNKNLEIYNETKHKHLLEEEFKIVIEEVEEKNEITEEVKEILEQKSEEQLEQIVEEVEEIIVSKKNKKVNK